MIDPLIYYYFSEEMQKEATTVGQAAGIGEKVLPHLESAAAGLRSFGGEFVEGLKAPLKMFSPAAHAESIRRMGNVHPEQLAEYKQSLEALAQKGHKYTVDYEHGTGMTNFLRRHGFLSGEAKYEGSSVPRKALNVLQRSLPGGQALNVGLTGLSVPMDLAATDPTTGRQRGWGERLGGAVANVGVGSAIGARMPSGKLPMAGYLGGTMLSMPLASAAGRSVGRGVDILASHLRRPSPVTGGAT